MQFTDITFQKEDDKLILKIMFNGEEVSEKFITHGSYLIIKCTSPPNPEGTIEFPAPNGNPQTSYRMLLDMGDEARLEFGFKMFNGQSKFAISVIGTDDMEDGVIVDHHYNLETDRKIMFKYFPAEGGVVDQLEVVVER